MRIAMYEFLEETVQNNMTRSTRSVAPETTVSDLLRLFAADDADAYPVASDGRVVGIVSKADALKAFGLKPAEIIPHYDELLGTTVDEIMTRQVTCVDLHSPLQRVLHVMVRHHFKSLPVVDNGNRLLGVIRRDDLIRALTRCTHEAVLPLTAPAVGYYAIA
jgi:CBS domain-containing protein